MWQNGKSRHTIVAVARSYEKERSAWLDARFSDRRSASLGGCLRLARVLDVACLCSVSFAAGRIYYTVSYYSSRL